MLRQLPHPYQLEPIRTDRCGRQSIVRQCLIADAPRARRMHDAAARQIPFGWLHQIQRDRHAATTQLYRLNLNRYSALYDFRTLPCWPRRLLGRRGWLPRCQVMR